LLLVGTFVCESECFMSRVTILLMYMFEIILYLENFKGNWGLFKETDLNARGFKYLTLFTFSVAFHYEMAQKISGHPIYVTTRWKNVQM